VKTLRTTGPTKAIKGRLASRKGGSGRITKSAGEKKKLVRPAGPVKKVTTAVKKPTGPPKKPRRSGATSAGVGKKARVLSAGLRSGLIRYGLARSFTGFSYRSWSTRWNRWLFYNPLDVRWYYYSPACGCWVRAAWIAYDPPDDANVEDDEPVHVWTTRALPEKNAPVKPPREPSSNPPQVPGVKDYAGNPQ
jgi:hypothetical protein